MMMIKMIASFSKKVASEVNFVTVLQCAVSFLHSFRDPFRSLIALHEFLMFFCKMSGNDFFTAITFLSSTKQTKRLGFLRWE